MASVHKDPRGKSRFYFAMFYDINGRRRHASTGATDRHDAERIALEFEAPYRKARKAKSAGEAVIPSEDAMHVFQKAYRLTAKGMLTESTLRELMAELSVSSGCGTLRTPSLAEFAEDWLGSKEVTVSAGTVARYRGIISWFLAFLGAERTGKDISLIRPADIRSYRDTIVKEGKGMTTANIELKTIRAMFTQARKEGLISSNPAESVETLREQQQQRDVFDISELSRMLAVASPVWQTMILLGYSTGARIQDCARMCWENVDFERGEIRYFPQKTAQGAGRKPDWRKNATGQLCVPMSDELAEHLLSIAGSDDPHGFLSPALASKGTGGSGGLSLAFRAVMKDAGIEGGEDETRKEGKGRRFNSLTFHSLRHSFVSGLANEGVSAEIRQSLSGHSDDEVHSRYTHLDMASKRAAIAKLPRITA